MIKEEALFFFISHTRKHISTEDQNRYIERYYIHTRTTDNNDHHKVVVEWIKTKTYEITNKLRIVPQAQKYTQELIDCNWCACAIILRYHLDP